MYVSFLLELSQKQKAGKCQHLNVCVIYFYFLRHAPPPSCARVGTVPLFRSGPGLRAARSALTRAGCAIMMHGCSRPSAQSLPLVSPLWTEYRMR